MPFVNEIPSAEEIEKYDLPYAEDLAKPVESRREWTVDHERNFKLWGGGATGNQAFDTVIYFRFYLCLDGLRFVVILDRGGVPMKFVDNPYVVVWNKIIEIRAVRYDLGQQVNLPKFAWENPDEPQALLGNRSLNEFIRILKEGLRVRGAGYYNRDIQNPIVVQFGF